MLERDQVDRVIGQNVHGSDGDKIGTARQIYTDDQTGRPEWVTVATGLFGTKETFIPLADATWSGESLTVPYEKSFVKDAPNLDEDGHLTPEQERELYAYYSLPADDTDAGYDTDAVGEGNVGDQTAAVGSPVSGRDSEAAGRDTSGPTTDDAMTVSEEQLRLGTEQRETGRARLRKHVVTENVTQTVPVQREEVRVEREPITEGNRDAALSGPAISEEEHEVVLHEERPAVEKEAVPVERVRLGTETVTDQATVDEEVRKERVDVDGAGESDVTDSADRGIDSRRA